MRLRVLLLCVGTTANWRGVPSAGNRLTAPAWHVHGCGRRLNVSSISVIARTQTRCPGHSVVWAGHCLFGRSCCAPRTLNHPMPGCVVKYFLPPDRLTPAPSSVAVKRFVRKGIPSNLRGQVWMITSGARRLQQAQPGETRATLCGGEEDIGGPTPPSFGVTLTAPCWGVSCMPRAVQAAIGTTQRPS